MNRILLALVVVLPAVPALAQEAGPSHDPATVPSGAYALDREHASLTFRVSHFGLSDYTARFTDFDASLDWNAEDPAASTLSVTIDPSSVRTDYPGETDFDAEIARDFLGAEANPEITFVSTGIEVTGETSGTVTGDLTFNGETRPVTLDVTFNGAFASAPIVEVPKLGFSATATIDRTEFGSDTYAPAIGAEIGLLIEAEFQPAE